MENADEVPRYYRCRGDAARPACSPPVQVAARHVEARVLTVLREAHISWFRDDRSRGFLEALAPAWAAWQRDDLGARNAMVRGLVWAAEWDRELGLTKLVLDDITVDAFIDEDQCSRSVCRRAPSRTSDAGCTDDASAREPRCASPDVSSPLRALDAAERGRWMLFALRELAASRPTETRPRAPKSVGGMSHSPL